jgi:hypothetical protein
VYERTPEIFNEDPPLTMRHDTALDLPEQADRASGTRTDEAGLVGDNDELSAVAGVQLHHGALDMSAHGQRAEEELSGDLLVGIAFGG